MSGDESKEPIYRIVRKSVMININNPIDNQKGNIYYKYIIEKAKKLPDGEIAWKKIESLTTESAARDYVNYLMKIDDLIVETYYI